MKRCACLYLPDWPIQRLLAERPELKGRGVEFIDEPEERPYGIDSSFRDPSGNNIRLTQVKELATV